MNTTEPADTGGEIDVNRTSDAPSTNATDPGYLGPEFPEFQIAADLWTVFGIIIILLGTIGHVLSLLVLLGSKRMRLLSLTVYLVANSLAGLAALDVGLLRQVILYLTNFDLDVRNTTSDFGCRFHALLTYLSLQLFTWLQAAIAIERTIAVTRPLHYKRWCTWRRNVIFVAVIVALLAFCNVIVAVVYHKTEEGRCSESPEHLLLFRKVWGYVDLILYSLFPVCVIVPCNALTLYSIYHNQMGSNASGRKYLQLTVMLVIQNCLCVATTLPVSIIFLLPWPPETYSAEGARRELDWTVLSLLQYLGTTFSFIIYSTSARRFRRGLLDIIFKGFNANVASLTATSSLRRSGNDRSLLKHRPAAAEANGNSLAAKAGAETDVLHGITAPN